MIYLLHRFLLEGTAVEKWIQKVKNFGWYYKTPLMIAAAVIIVLIYLALQTVGVSEPDYHIGLVRASG